MTIVVNVHEAKTHFSKLLEQARAGEEIVVAKAGKPYARLVALAADTTGRTAGRLTGHVGPEFFEPLPDSELARWNKQHS